MNFEWHLLTGLDKVFCSEDFSPEVPLARKPVFHAARGERISFQAAFKFSEQYYHVKTRFESPIAEHICMRRVGNVPCAIPEVNKSDPDLLQRGPGLYPDPLLPVDGPFPVPAGLWQSVWFTAEIPEDIAPGNYPVRVYFDTWEDEGLPWKTGYNIGGYCELNIRVHEAVLPEDGIICTNWFYADCISEYYGVEPWCEKFWEILENYFTDFVRHGRNMLLTPLWSVPLDTAIGHERPTCQLLDISWADGKYSFDFGKLKRWIDLGKKCGVTYFEMSHIFTQWGAEAAPKIMVSTPAGVIRKFGWDVAADSPEYQEFLNALLPELLDFLRREGLAGKCYFHISDEPGLSMMEKYKKASLPLLKYLKDDEFPVIDALSAVEFFREGLIRRPVVFLGHADEFAAENIEHRWCYFSGGATGMPGRAYSMPSFRYRILGVLLYLYDMEGFLHWGHNFWFTQYSLNTKSDPWRDPTAGMAFCGGNCFNVFPGDEGKPVDCIHYEVFAEALQDLKLLRLLEKRIGRSEVEKIIGSGLEKMPRMNDFPHSAQWLWDLRSRIFAALDK